jgi:arginyl-tRNA synthetase
MSSKPQLLFPSSLRNRLTAIFTEAFASVGAPPELGLVTTSQKPELGDFQCNGAMQAARPLKKNPREIADQIVEIVSRRDEVTDLSIAGPGFINFRVADDFLASFADLMERDDRLGLSAVTEPATVVLDFGGPNVAKPMHVGHLRSSIIGDSLQRLFRFLGHNIISDIHLGDWGTQMGMLIEAVRREHPGLPYFDREFSGPYPAVSPVSIEDLQRL